MIISDFPFYVFFKYSVTENGKKNTYKWTTDGEVLSEINAI
jgi:hypothetical protein